MIKKAQFSGVSTFITGSEADGIRRALEVRRAWGNWLSGFLWHHFATLTFPEQPSPAAAIGHLRTSRRWLEQRAQERVCWFYALERGAAGLLHLHVLLSGTGRLPPASVAAAWPRGRADVSIYDPKRGATYYVSKAITTDVVEYDIDLPTAKTPPLPPGPPWILRPSARLENAAGSAHIVIGCHTSCDRPHDLSHCSACNITPRHTSSDTSGPHAAGGPLAPHHHRPGGRAAGLVPRAAQGILEARWTRPGGRVHLDWTSPAALRGSHRDSHPCGPQMPRGSFSPGRESSASQSAVIQHPPQGASS
jgi:hypothetical protein